METRRPRALRMRPMLAAVMPLPREEVTPPVTKTYFAMGRVLRGFFQCYRKRPPESNRTGRPRRRYGATAAASSRPTVGSTMKSGSFTKMTTIARDDGKYTHCEPYPVLLPEFAIAPASE